MKNIIFLINRFLILNYEKEANTRYLKSLASPVSGPTIQVSFEQLKGEKISLYGDTFRQPDSTLYPSFR